MALCAPVLNRNMETELQRKEWLHYFARQRGTQEASASRPVPLAPLPLVIRERLHRQAGICDKDRGSHRHHSFFCSFPLFPHLFAEKRWDRMP